MALPIVLVLRRTYHTPSMIASAGRALTPVMSAPVAYSLLVR
jgi:hypothetical protein